MSSKKETMGLEDSEEVVLRTLRPMREVLSCLGVNYVFCVGDWNLLLLSSMVWCLLLLWRSLP